MAGDSFNLKLSWKGYVIKFIISGYKMANYVDISSNMDNSMISASSCKVSDFKLSHWYPSPELYWRTFQYDSWTLTLVTPEAASIVRLLHFNTV